MKLSGKVYGLAVFFILMSVLCTTALFGCSSEKGEGAQNSTTTGYGDNDADINDFFGDGTTAATNDEGDGQNADVTNSGNSNSSGTGNTVADSAKSGAENTQSTKVNQGSATSNAEAATSADSVVSRKSTEAAKQPLSTNPAATSPLESALQKADSSEGVSFGDII